MTQQESTVSEYADRVAMLMRRADEALGRQATLLEAINYLGDLHDEYKPASLRKYFAALTWAVDAAVDLGQLGIEQEAVHRAALSCRPRPRPADAPTRTSAKKRKNVTKDDLGKVCTFLWQRGKLDDRLLVRLLVHGILLVLRPSEYSDAAIEGDLLTVRSRKTTNQRGLGDFRELDLAGISEDETASIEQLIADFATASQEQLDLLIDRLGHRLRRACIRLGIEPCALYTTRHQGIANLKAAGKSAPEIAAIAGHRSTRTANRSYAPRSSGWKHAATIGATVDMIDKVNARATPLQPASPKIR
ncbi:hypothetical protein [Devosia limi]|uniref:hypothetical protein n=1 Tax=Devosia limi TaxID=288995 RepID=UPI0011605AAC|nr:hypothetical protein [Devosia limi]